METTEPIEPERPEWMRFLGFLLRGIWRPAAIIFIVALIIVILEPARLVSELSELREWFREQGLPGVLVFLGLYVIAAIAIVPQAALKVAAGGVYGALLGVVVASVGSTLGAMMCFLIARYVARGSLMKHMRKGRRFQRLDQLTQKHGAVIVAMSRLVPILPGNLLNYAFGLTQVRLGVFVLWSWIGMLPGTVVLVVGTDAFVRGIDEGRVPWTLLIIVLCALALLSTAFVYAHRQFRRSAGNSIHESEYADL